MFHILNIFFLDWRGRNILKSLLFSVYLIGYGLTFYYAEFGDFITFLCFSFVLYCFSLVIMYRPFALLMPSVPLLFVINNYNPDMLRKLNAAVNFCIDSFIQIFSFVVTYYEGLPLFFLIYFFVLFKARFEIRNYLSVSLKVAVFLFPFGCVILCYVSPHILSTIYDSVKVVIALIIVIVGLKCCIW